MIDNDDNIVSDRAWMRERFIRMAVNLKGRPADVKMHSDTNVSGVWETADGQFSEVLISDVHTPRPEIFPKVILRVDDIISINIPL